MESVWKWKFFVVPMGWAGLVGNGVIMIGVEGMSRPLITPL
jgi:hypothetical protein